jgi:hypothetical protein
MKSWLVTATILLTMFFVSCTTNPAPQQGPAGPQGQAGQSGQSGQQGAQGQSGQQGQTGDTGQTGQTGQQGEKGQKGVAAPCPAGQHRYTDPATGEVRCVRD